MIDLPTDRPVRDVLFDRLESFLDIHERSFNPRFRHVIWDVLSETVRTPPAEMARLTSPARRVITEFTTFEHPEPCPGTDGCLKLLQDINRLADLIGLHHRTRILHQVQLRRSMTGRLADTV